ncbi:MAG: DNA cytosine methyltransferase, partial [Verrucomicrobiales bacterium]
YMKILNLYAGIGGNRRLWGDEHEITAVESDPEIAAVYKAFFPNDTVIVGDAHQYLLEHLNEFDFIWSSPPCPTHSQIRYNIGFLANRKYAKVAPVYPDMTLYQEIILLKYYFAGNWIVENTVPYYEPLIEGTKTGGHIWWSSFHIPPIDHGSRGHRDGTVESLQKRKMLDLTPFDIKDKRKLLRNCVEPEVGLHMLNAAFSQPELKVA